MKGQITKTAFSLAMSALGLFSLSGVIHENFLTGLLMTHLAALFFAVSAMVLPKSAGEHQGCCIYEFCCDGNLSCCPYT